MTDRDPVRVLLERQRDRSYAAPTEEYRCDRCGYRTLRLTHAYAHSHGHGRAMQP